MKQVFASPTGQKGWTYYIDTGFAWVPMYCQGTLIWLKTYWVTWPEDRNGTVIEMYRVYFPYDPRRRQAQAGGS